jgi:hypothetical protein
MPVGHFSTTEKPREAALAFVAFMKSTQNLRRGLSSAR